MSPSKYIVFSFLCAIFFSIGLLAVCYLIQWPLWLAVMLGPSIFIPSMAYLLYREVKAGNIKIVKK